MAGHATPAIGVQQSLDERAVAAARLAEHGTLSRLAPDPEPRLDRGDHLVEQKILPLTQRRGIDVLVSAQRGEAIGEGGDDGTHRTRSDQSIQSLGQVLTEALPGEQLGPAADEAGQPDEQRIVRVGLIVALRQVDPDRARRGIPQEVAREGAGLHGQPDEFASRRIEVVDRHRRSLRTRSTRSTRSGTGQQSYRRVVVGRAAAGVRGRRTDQRVGAATLGKPAALVHQRPRRDAVDRRTSDEPASTRLPTRAGPALPRGRARLTRDAA